LTSCFYSSTKIVLWRPLESAQYVHSHQQCAELCRRHGRRASGAFAISTVNDKIASAGRHSTLMFRFGAGSSRLNNALGLQGGQNFSDAGLKLNCRRKRENQTSGYLPVFSWRFYWVIGLYSGERDIEISITEVDPNERIYVPL
jgi:hypothetical protein